MDITAILDNYLKQFRLGENSPFNFAEADLHSQIKTRQPSLSGFYV
jgi:hypothetical protein